MKYRNTHNQIKTSEGGYTLLFSVLVAALALGVAVFILSVSTKQYELSVSARESMYAFYAADAGIECAAAAFSSGGLDAFADTLATSTDPDSNHATITCGVQSDGSTPQTISVGFTGPYMINTPHAPVPPLPIKDDIYPVYVTVDTATGNLAFGLQNIQNGQDITCVNIRVWDGYDDAVPPNHWTIVDSRGYNHCFSQDDPNNANRPNTDMHDTVERALRLSKEG